MEPSEADIYAMIGDEGFARLVAGFYQRVPQDDLLGPMYDRRDLAAAEWRLREFLVGRFGGPTRYVEKRGHPRLRMRHVPFKIDRAARDRWLSLMEQSLAEAQLPPAAETTLRQFFHDAAAFLVNQE